MNITVIIPAFNEEACLLSTLDSIEAAADRLRSCCKANIETMVVDNNSTDSTASVAIGRGAKAIHEAVQGISRARNTGARHAGGDILVFVDADVLVPIGLFDTIHAVMSNPDCVGGGVGVEYRPRRIAIGLYLRAWRLLSRSLGMVQGEPSSVPETPSRESADTMRRRGLGRTSTSSGH